MLGIKNIIGNIKKQASKQGNILSPVFMKASLFSKNILKEYTKALNGFFTFSDIKI